MKICAACHKHLPKESYSKKQWKLDKCQRRCKVCVTNNREIQYSLPKKQYKDTEDKIISTKEVIKSLDSMCMENMKEISDEDLFKQPPRKEDCPICFLRMPYLTTGCKYMSCCGKVICGGCVYAPLYDHQGNKVAEKLCSFCRTPVPKSEEGIVERYERRIQANDDIAIHKLGMWYSEGSSVFKQNHERALDLWHRGLTA